MKHKEFTARTELKSLTRSIKCVETECGHLELLSECLGDSSMRLGIPFIAPRQLGAVGSQQGRKFLPSIGWRTGQSDAPPDLCVGWRTGHYRCTPDSPVPPADRWRGPRVTRGLRGRPLRWRPLAHRTVRCTTEQSGEL
jgi:hypothetical protein